MCRVQEFPRLLLRLNMFDVEKEVHSGLVTRLQLHTHLN